MTNDGLGRQGRTTFGEFCHILRTKRRIRSMREFGKKLGYSVAYVSAIELGNRPILDHYLKKIIDQLKLTAAEEQELWLAACASGYSIKVAPDGTLQSKACALFVANINRLPTARVLELILFLESNSSLGVAVVNERRKLATKKLNEAFDQHEKGLAVLRKNLQDLLE